MTAHKFLIDKGVLSLKESYSVYEIQKWLEEYAQIVLNIAAEKAEIGYDSWDDPFIDKGSIINCLKD